MKIQNKDGFKKGYTVITEHDKSKMLMDFGILALQKNEIFDDVKPLEKAYILLSGEIEVIMNDKIYKAARGSCFDSDMWCLNADKNTKFTVKCLSEDCEIAVLRTENDKEFDYFVYDKTQIVTELRGDVQMDGAAKRLVRTAMQLSTSPHSNMMLGEGVCFPGRWAGFPPHYHEQPEIYFYRFNPDNGFGFIKVGDEPVLLENNDTIPIDKNLVHPNVTAPGYEMYFLWIIRHLDGNPYNPYNEEQHMWALNK